MGTEADFAAFACKPLDTDWSLKTLVGANLLKRPGAFFVVVVQAVRVWAVGRAPGISCLFCWFHTLRIAGDGPDTISEAQPNF